MNSGGVLRGGTAISFLLALVGATSPPAAHAAVGDALWTITPTVATTVDNVSVDPTCDAQGGTSMAIVPGPKLAGVDPVQHPVVLATTCLDNGGSAAAIDRRARVNFLNLSTGQVIKSIKTKTSAGVLFTPSNGWAHLVHRPDFGDLLGCGNDGTIWTINFNQFPTTADDGVVTSLPRPSGLPNNCAGLGWDAEEDMIYQGVTGGTGIVGVYRFKTGTTTLVLPSFNTPCAPIGVAITGGVVVVACDGVSTMLRLDKNTGGILGVNGTLGVLGFLPGTSLNPDLGDLACDPVSFAGQFKDAMWSRNGSNGNGVVALEFPAFTCGLPSNATVLAAGLSGAACFDEAGNVKDTDGDGLPDCWEDGTLWGDGSPGIDFDGDGVRDLALCVLVDTNGDGVPDATECADKNRKELFVEIDYMQDHKPDPQTLSQTQGVASVGVKSVREAFAAAPVASLPSGPVTGIRAHFQVDEQVTFLTLAGTGPTSHVTEVAFTPCTGPGGFAISQSDAADFDTIKKGNFGTAADRNNTDFNAANRLNAKRLAFRYVVFAHKQIGTSQGGGSGSSGCAEVEGDDAVVTLGAFTTTIVGGVSHPRGTTDQQAGTFMHELGHTLGLRHGGFENVNCKPNYLSVMSYSRQFAGSPILNRRLDFSRAALQALNENAGLNEPEGLGSAASLGPILPFFPSADQTAFGPSAWSVVTAGPGPINWNRDKKGQTPDLTDTNVSANINQGPGGCDGAGTSLVGDDDWSNLLYRFSAALDFAGGVRTDTPQEITKAQEEEFFLAGDLDANGIADAQDCGAFLCTHRIDIKPSFPVPKVISLGAEATITIAIFSEPNGAQVSLAWNAPALVQTATLTFGVESLVFPVKVNNKGGGTCSTSDVADPVTGQKDGIKDLKCQFPTSGLPLGTHQGVVSGFFLQAGELRAFRARQDFTVVP